MELRYFFEPVPGPTHGQSMLYVYKLDYQPGYSAVIGGCSVGHRESLAEAETLLLEKAKAMCQRRIEEARFIAMHYEECLQRLEKEGLKPL